MKRQRQLKDAAACIFAALVLYAQVLLPRCSRP